MKRIAMGLLGLFVTAAGFAQSSPAQRVADDALVIDRVTEASKRDLPKDLLLRIVEEDIDLLRGKRADGTYQYATYERFEDGRTTRTFSIRPKAEEMQTVEVKGAFVYRVLLDVPSRRMLVRKNLPVWIERVDMEFIPDGSSRTERSSVEVKAWQQPGEVRPVDIPAVSRQATIRVVATVAPDGGYGNLDVALVQAKVVDKVESPYADAVSSARAVQRSLQNGELPSVRAMAQRMRASLVSPAARREVLSEPVVTEMSPASSGANQVEMQAELQLIEDLLTGSEEERRQGMDRLHQLIRTMRR